MFEATTTWSRCQHAFTVLILLVLGLKLL